MMQVPKIPVAIVIVVLAVLAGVFVLCDTRSHPRTDDATVRADYVEFAPEVSGRIVSLPVRDNQYVHKGDVLFLIDPRAYQYALDQALADQQLLESQIDDAQRRIAAERSAVHAANAAYKSAAAHVDVMQSGVAHAESALASAQAQRTLAVNNLSRMEPLLAKQYVTTEQVDELRTRVQVAAQNVAAAEAALRQAHMQEREASAGIDASSAHVEQSEHSVDTLDSLSAQRPMRQARVQQARLDLERCRVVAPFDGYVTNLTIAEGEYGKPGAPVFTLIDTNSWYITANYRETDLRHIRTGRHVDVYLMNDPNRRFDGVVESIGYGVNPDESNRANGLPQIDHTMNWVHLAARFPVRIRVTQPDPQLFRMGVSAITVVR
ncbi:MAG: HlyD family efflux transporter periplasmic adaptor subunit [Acidobacteriota bacterium]|nr:HlyD family efflux transporter periplasmic adaptor subunit [Acidobacteriota bacterium]